jgi:hypothetical protein
MDQLRNPLPRLPPLPADPTLEKQFEASKKALGFVPNSLLSGEQGRSRFLPDGGRHLRESLHHLGLALHNPSASLLTPQAEPRDANTAWRTRSKELCISE